MNTKQMEETEKMLTEMLEKNAELSELFDRLSPSDKQVYFPKLMASFNRTEKLIKDARANQLPAVAVRG